MTVITEMLSADVVAAGLGVYVGRKTVEILYIHISDIGKDLSRTSTLDSIVRNRVQATAISDIKTPTRGAPGGCF